MPINQITVFGAPEVVISGVVALQAIGICRFRLLSFNLEVLSANTYGIE